MNVVLPTNTTPVQHTVPAMSILVVDDDTSLRTSLEQAIRQEGYMVAMAANGKDALSTMQNARIKGTPFDLILCDIRMQEIDGIDVMRVAHKEPYEPAIILMTGYASVDTAVAALHFGASNYLLKPCATEDVLFAISDALVKRELHQTYKKATQTIGHMRQIVQGVAYTQTEYNVIPSYQSLRTTNKHSTTSKTSTVQEEIVLQKNMGQYLHAKDIRLDDTTHKVYCNNQHVQVTPIQYKLLYFLIVNQGNVMKYSDIFYYTHQRKTNEQEASQLLRWHVGQLEKKIGEHYIDKVRGVGYSIRM